MGIARSRPSDIARPAPSPGRVILAVIAGALCGAGLVAGWMLVAGVATGQADYGLMLAALAFMIALPVWAAGLLVIGLPIGSLLHLRGVRSRRAAAGAGAILTSAPSAIWVGVLGAAARSSIKELAAMAPFVAGMALAGAIVGQVVAYVAYGPSTSKGAIR